MLKAYLELVCGSLVAKAEELEVASYRALLLQVSLELLKRATKA